MMRALWTGATGMISQQTALDNISNNIANVNTTGFKKEEAQFQSLLYSKLQTKTTDSDGNAKPVIGQVGLGTKVSGIVSSYTQGPLEEADSMYDLAIEGSGFFMVRQPDGTTAYTRDGEFGLSLTENGICIADAEGDLLLDSNGEPITFSSDTDTSKIEIDDDGNINYPDADGNVVNTGVTIGRAQFNNPSGLEKLSNSLLSATSASGEPRIEGVDSTLKVSQVHSGYLEGSNVQVANEMVDLIVTQRAYEMNSKVITASDEMLQQANNLRS